ncbi:hypothetical protein FVE85_2620 [Porphyridium purpureum]|uniref:Uncharacterized protein n=1 Tax=Porphyridium purpureum TaxID=35688 RepID=A0A5J4YSK4_PORPP|nr:hypothetical protein FVE85_2620 [Porphyridium purpureum]|eukprot:POR0768..scf227_4
MTRAWRSPSATFARAVRSARSAAPPWPAVSLRPCSTAPAEASRKAKSKERALQRALGVRLGSSAGAASASPPRASDNVLAQVEEQSGVVMDSVFQMTQLGKPYAPQLHPILSGDANRTDVHAGARWDCDIARFAEKEHLGFSRDHSPNASSADEWPSSLGRAPFPYTADRFAEDKVMDGGKSSWHADPFADPQQHIMPADERILRAWDAERVFLRSEPRHREFVRQSTCRSTINLWAAYDENFRLSPIVPQRAFLLRTLDDKISARGNSAAKRSSKVAQAAKQTGSESPGRDEFGRLRDRISSCASPVSVARLVADTLAAQRLPETLVMNAAWHALLHRRDALQAMEALQSAHVVLPVRLIDALRVRAAARLFSQRKYSEGLDLLQNVSALGRQQIGLLISSLADPYVRVAMRLVDRMAVLNDSTKSRRSRPSPPLLNRILALALRRSSEQRQPFAQVLAGVREVIAHRAQLQVPLNVRSFELLVEHCFTREDLTTTFTLVQEYFGTSMLPRGAVHGILCDAFVKRYLWLDQRDSQRSFSSEIAEQPHPTAVVRGDGAGSLEGNDVSSAKGQTPQAYEQLTQTSPFGFADQSETQQEAAPVESGPSSAEPATETPKSAARGHVGGEPEIDALMREHLKESMVGLLSALVVDPSVHSTARQASSKLNFLVSSHVLIDMIKFFTYNLVSVPPATYSRIVRHACHAGATEAVVRMAQQGLQNIHPLNRATARAVAVYVSKRIVPRAWRRLSFRLLLDRYRALSARDFVALLQALASMGYASARRFHRLMENAMELHHIGALSQKQMAIVATEYFRILVLSSSATTTGNMSSRRASIAHAIDPGRPFQKQVPVRQEYAAVASDAATEAGLWRFVDTQRLMGRIFRSPQAFQPQYGLDSHLISKRSFAPLQGVLQLVSEPQNIQMLMACGEKPVEHTDAQDVFDNLQVTAAPTSGADALREAELVHTLQVAIMDHLNWMRGEEVRVRGLHNELGFDIGIGDSAQLVRLSSSEPAVRAAELDLASLHALAARHSDPQHFNFVRRTELPRLALAAALPRLIRVARATLDEQIAALDVRELHGAFSRSRMDH